MIFEMIFHCLRVFKDVIDVDKEPETTHWMSPE